MIHHPAILTPYLWKGVIAAYSGSILPIILWNSLQHPKCIMLKRMKKAQGPNNKPASINKQNTSAVNARVLKVALFRAIRKE
jgi:hypothetical protein